MHGLKYCIHKSSVFHTENNSEWKTRIPFILPLRKKFNANVTPGYRLYYFYFIYTCTFVMFILISSLFILLRFFFSIQSSLSEYLWYILILLLFVYVVVVVVLFILLYFIFPSFYFYFALSRIMITRHVFKRNERIKIEENLFRVY